MTALLCLPFQITTIPITYDMWGFFFSCVEVRSQFHLCLILHDENPIYLFAKSDTNITEDLYSFFHFSAHMGEFMFALQDGWAAVSVATEAAGVTVPTDLPVMCGWSLGDPGSHGSQQHHPWDAGLVSDLMTSRLVHWAQKNRLPQMKLLLTFKPNMNHALLCF